MSPSKNQDDKDHAIADDDDIEAERHELAELIGRLLAWDWLERRAKSRDHRGGPVDSSGQTQAVGVSEGPKAL